MRRARSKLDTVSTHPARKSECANRARCGGIAAVGLLLAIAYPLRAADPDMAIEKLRPKTVGKLVLKLRPSLGAIRSDAPFAIDLDLESTFSDVLEGELQLSFVDDRAPCARVRTGPMAIPNGQKSFHLFLPAMSAKEERANFVVQAVFYGSRGTLDLGVHDLVVPLKGQRQFVVAVAGLGDATVNQFARQLSLDAFRPPDAVRSVLLTLPVELDLHSIPANPIGLYPFDVLVFIGEHFSRLSTRQLDTIAEWIETGGGAVIVPTGVLTPAHAQFLKRISSANAIEPRFLLDRFGRVPTHGTGAKDWLITCRFGYGRALIINGLPAQNADGSFKGVDPAAWTRTVCFLWNVQPDQTERILKDGHWTPWSTGGGEMEVVNLAPQRHLGVTQARVYRSHYSEYDDRLPLHAQTLSQADNLRALLFPKEVRVVPFGVVATILTLFLFAIAPADYLMLGLLRCRRYTWIVFPTSCMLFTVATVCVAQHYTGTIDHRGALVIVDVGEKGQPLRTTRIEHVITAGTRRVSTEIKDGLFSVTAVQPLRSSDAGRAKPSESSTRANLGAEMETDPLEYVGTLPSTVTVTRVLRQWTPSMARVTTIGAQAALPRVPWSEIERLDASTGSGRKAVAERVQKAVPDSELLFVTPSENQQVAAATSTSGPDSRFAQWPAILAALARRTEGRLFSVVSRISPNGAGDLEDLAVLDIAQADACLLHVTFQRGDDLIVLRRMLQGKGRSTRD